MREEDVREHWQQFRHKIKAQWGKLTEEELDQIAGDRERLIGKVQDKYGIPRDEAERQVEAVSRGVAGDDPR
jgi:uncharacterized protein YjbJ (UPF0337 family)